VFQHAIVRLPGANFADGLTTADLGTPSFERVLTQHTRYCDALRECGLSLITLAPDLQHPDSTFVEDTAILTSRGAVLTRPGAPSRLGEVDSIRSAIEGFFPAPDAIHPPGTLDGGDICQAGDHFFLGLSQRTNPEGARQLAASLARFGYTSSTIDIRSQSGILHLKSGVSFLGDNTLVMMEEMAGIADLSSFDLIGVSPVESYAANCVRVNDRVLVAEGHPRLIADLEARGFHPIVLDMSEFRKMDGGLSCLSLRF
jgi:dimethylargininase